MGRTRYTGWACMAAGMAAMAMVGTANAADMDYIPAPSVGYNWTGFYVGGAAGYINARARNQHDTELFDPLLLTSTIDSYTTTIKPDGGLFGGYAGYNWQMPGSGFVFGLDGDFYASTAKKSSTIEVYPGGMVDMRQKVKTTWAARARVGWAVESFMAYLAGGYAGASLDTRLSDANWVGSSSTSSSSTHHGWTIGGGIDFLVTPNWIVGVDYQYKDLGHKTTTFTADYAGPPALEYTNSVRTKLTSNQFSFRAGYKF
ncbi:MAG: outer membrane protein [Hyphomicrobiales bacterium]